MARLRAIAALGLVACLALGPAAAGGGGPAPGPYTEELLLAPAGPLHALVRHAG